MKKKTLINLIVFSLLITSAISAKFYYVNNFNALAYKVDNIQEAREGVDNLDNKEKQALGSDFNANFIEDTSYIIEIDDQIMYGQGYYMTYNVDQNLVYCVDPLTTATRVINVDDLTNPDNTKYSKLSLDSQEKIKQILLATETIYSKTNNPEDLVAAQILVWEASGAEVIETSSNISDNMEVINQEVDETEIEDEIELNYYDTSGQDLVGDSNTQIPSVTIPGESNDDNSTSSTNQGIEFNATNGYGRVNDEDINFETFQATVIDDGKDVSDQIIVNSDDVNYSEQGRYDVTLTYERQELYLYYYVLDTDAEEPEKNQVNLYGEQAYINENDQLNENDFNEFGFYIDGNGLVIDLQTEIEISSVQALELKRSEDNDLNVGEYSVTLSATYNQIIGEDTQTLIVVDEEAILPIEDDAPYVYGEDLILKEGNADNVDFTNKENYQAFGYDVSDKDISDSIKVYNADGSQELQQSDIDVDNPGIYPITLIGKDTDSNQTSYAVNIVVVDEEAILPMEDDAPYVYGEDLILKEGNEDNIDFTNKENYQAFGYDVSDKDISDSIKVYNADGSQELQQSDIDVDNPGIYPITLIGEDADSNQTSYSVNIVVVDEEAILPIEDDAPYVYGEDLILKEGNADNVDFTNKENYQAFGYDFSDKDISDSIKVYNADGSQELQQSDIDVNQIGMTPITLIGEDADSNQTSYSVNIVVVDEEAILPIEDDAPYVYGEDLIIKEGNADNVDFTNKANYNLFGYDVSEKDISDSIKVYNADGSQELQQSDIDVNQIGMTPITLIGEDADSNQTSYAVNIVVVDEEAILPIEDDAPYVYGEDLIIKEGNADNVDFTNKANYNLFGYDVSEKDISDSIKVYNADGSQELQQSDIDVNQIGMTPITLIGEDADSNQTSYAVNIVVVDEEAILPMEDDAPYIYGEDLILKEGNEDNIDFTNKENYQAFGYDVSDKDISDSIKVYNADGSQELQQSDIDVNQIGMTPITLIGEDADSNQTSYSVNIVVVDEEAILPIEDDAPYIYGEDLIIKEGNEDSIDFTNKANYNLFGYDVSDKDISDSIKLYNIDGSQELQQSDIDVYNPGIYPITLIGEDADSNQTSYIVNIVVVAEEDYPLDQNGNPYMYAKDFILYEDETGVDFTDPSNYQAFGYDMEDRDITTSIEFDIQSSDIDVSTPVIQPVTLTLSDSEGNQIEQVVNIVILKEDTRVIESCRDLESIGKGENYQGATHVNAWDYTDEYYVADDIDCAENSDTSIYGSDGFDPIGLGESGPVFSGYFNGGGHSINNLYINNSSLNSIGLFTKIESDATVENININNADVVGKNSVGLLAGHNEGTINSSSSGGKVNGSGSVGGLVGYNNGPINQSYSQALVTSTGSDTGGLVGGGSYGVINNSYATGGVTGSDNTGGLVGRGNDVSNSYATGNVIGKNQVGGLVGNSEDINNSYAIGNVFGKKYVGGLAGLLVNQHQVEYTYATGNVTGTESVGGLVGGANSRTFVGSSYSTSNVSADDLLGGLIGKTLDVTIEYSYAAGDVIGTGLVGPNDIHIGPVVSSSSIPQKCYGYENQLISNNGYDNAQNPDAATNIATYDNLTDVDNWYNDYLKWDETNAWIFGQTNDNGNFVYPSLLNDETGLLITGQEEEVITQIGT